MFLTFETRLTQTSFTMETLILPRKLSLPTKDIMYLECDSNYTNIITKNGHTNHCIALSLCKIQPALKPSDFIRVNRSYMINLSSIRQYTQEKDAIYFTLYNNKKLKSSRRRTGAILSILKKHLN